MNKLVVLRLYETHRHYRRGLPLIVPEAFMDQLVKSEDWDEFFRIDPGVDTSKNERVFVCTPRFAVDTLHISQDKDYVTGNPFWEYLPPPNVITWSAKVETE